MFRTKTKKKAGGAAARKRKDLDDEEDQDEQTVVEPTVEMMEVDEGDVPVANVPQTEEDQDESEDALLARMRSRVQKSKGKGASSMSFSSKATTTKKKNTRSFALGDDEEDENIAVSAAAGGCLSFEEDADMPSKKASKKLRIRPNLNVAHTTDDGDEEEDTGKTNLYSQDMLASLLREQKVLLRRAPAAEPMEDDAMEVDQEEVVTGIVDEEIKGESADEEFIPLNAQFMQAKKHKKRVTFGVQREEYYPPKGAEVEEPVPTSDVEEDEDVDQSKRWEEELMRRGGGHHVQPQQPKAARYDLKAAYPTRRKVPCASLGEVMRNIQRKLAAGSMERDRTARELARLDAESELIQKNLQQQREELLVASEQFEYFQVIEDFVKGLSFCLRNKLPAIETEEQRRGSLWLSSRSVLRDRREQDIRDEIRVCIEQSAIQERQFVNLPPNIRDQETAQGHDADERLARLRRRYETTFEQETSRWELFADAVEEISSIQKVYGRFQEWKRKFPDVYKDAYTDLASSKLYAPYVRVELINWDPLGVSMSSATARGYPTRVSDMEWFRVLRKHYSVHNAVLEEPVITLLREVVVTRIADATKTRFDAFSPVHTQSLVDLIDDLVQLHAVPHIEHGLDEIIGNVLASLTGEAKRMPLVALDDQDAANDRTRFFGALLVSEFCGLLENALTFFVALPSGALHQRGFNAVMQILHHLLAYATHCKHLGKTALLPQIQRTTQQLSSSAFMQSLLARSTHEQLELQRVLALLASSAT